MNPTEEQVTAIACAATNIVCMASAGSGKTATIINRIRRLIIDGVDPADICVITYTNAAARELLARLQPEDGSIRIVLGFCGTLHRFCLRLLLEAGGKITVLAADEADRELIEAARNAGVKASDKDLTTRREWWHIRRNDQQRDAIHIAVASYYRAMAAENIVDYNSILTQALDLLDDAYYPQKRWAHLFVDELQDASALDITIYGSIDAANRFYVGDPDQAIFGWRGGDVSGINGLAADKEWTTLLLEGNFRSAPEICAAAQRLIERAAQRVQKTLVSLTNKHGSVGTKAFTDDVDEAAGVAIAIAAAMTAPIPYPANEVAVLCRTNRIAENIRASLHDRGVATREPVKQERPKDWPAAIAFVRWLASGTDDALRRWLRNRVITDERVFQQPDAELQRVYRIGCHFNLEDLDTDCFYNDVSAESRAQIKAIREKLTEPYSLYDVAFAMTAPDEPEEQGDGVYCGTIHGAKGREFEVVILAGCEDEVIPGPMRRDIEEERRLAYVAMTRAKTVLWVTHAEYRTRQWQGGGIERHTPSRFIAEARL